MSKLRILPSARADFVHVLRSVGRESGSVAIGERIVRKLRKRCAELALLPATLGRPRPEVAVDVRSLAEGSFVIFFRYTPSHLEVVAIIDGRRDASVMQAHLHSALKQ